MAGSENMGTELIPVPKPLPKAITVTSQRGAVCSQAIRTGAEEISSPMMASPTFCLVLSESHPPARSAGTALKDRTVVATATSGALNCRVSMRYAGIHVRTPYTVDILRSEAMDTRMSAVLQNGVETRYIVSLPDVGVMSTRAVVSLPDTVSIPAVASLPLGLEPSRAKPGVVSLLAGGVAGR